MLYRTQEQLNNAIHLNDRQELLEEQIVNYIASNKLSVSSPKQFSWKRPATTSLYQLRLKIKPSPAVAEYLQANYYNVSAYINDSSAKGECMYIYLPYYTRTLQSSKAHQLINKIYNKLILD